jgi:hypothetical protein
MRKKLDETDVWSYDKAMKWFAIPCSIILCIFISCAGDAPPAANDTPSPIPRAAPEVFDPSAISLEEKNIALEEIQQLIQRLNNIIRNGQYAEWVSYLDPGYYALINQPEYLEQVSQSPTLRRDNRILRSSRDYFNYVVVPARANDRVDDIEFVSQNSVIAYQVISTDIRRILYRLVKIGNDWKITN